MLKTRQFCNFVYLIVCMVVCMVFVLQSFFYPNFILAEEHHYLEVASNLFYHPKGVVLEDTMGMYLSKPPLLFWILTGLWKIFGVHHWVIHFFLMSILAGILYFTQCLYKILFADSEHAKLVPMIILGSFLFFSRSTVFCFDSLVVLFFVLSAVGIVFALKHFYIRGFVLYGVAVGLGVLTKGPIILAFCLPFFIVATFLRRHYNVRDRAWFLGFAFSFLIAVILVLIWLVPLLHQLSPVRQHMLLFRRGFGVGSTYGHAPFYFYIKACFFLFLPWLLWPYGLKSLCYVIQKNNNVNFKLVFYSLLLSLIVLSIIPSKALRYAMSLMPLFSILYAYALFQNKTVFHGTRILLCWFIGIVAIIEGVTLCYPEWVMSKMMYPAITYSWLLLTESLVVILGLLLVSFKTKTIVCEVARLCGFMCVLVISTTLLPREVMSESFDYRAFVTFLNDAKDKHIPIVYCRAYGGYQYGLSSPSLPDAKYTLTAKEGERETWVYFVEQVNHAWRLRQTYFYRLVDPGQTSAIFVRKIPVREVVNLSFKQQRC